jgi:hypothetical protein
MREALSRIEGMLESVGAETLAVRRRRESRREESSEQTQLVKLLARYLDRSCTFWTSLENKPISAVSGMHQKRRGVRSGLPDVFVMYRHGTDTIVIFIELKSRRGVASRVQKQIRLEVLPVGAEWWMARSARAAMMALHLSGVVFKQPWNPPKLQPWEGPFPDPNKRLPQHPRVAAERRAARQRWRKRQRASKAAKPVAARDDGAGGDIAA